MVRSTGAFRIAGQSRSTAPQGGAARTMSCYDSDTFPRLFGRSRSLRCRMFRPGFAAPVFLALIVSAACGQAQTPTPTPTPKPTPVPNTVDLSKFKGKYRGFTKVTTDSGALYRGSSKTRVSRPSKTSLKLQITGAIRASDRTIQVGNRLAFTDGGVLHGRNLAPGVLKKAQFKALYTATVRRIEFKGTYKIQDLTGRFTGTLTAGKSGRFTLRYSIFPGESVVAAYVYQYSGKTGGSR